MNHALKGLLVVAILAALLFAGWKVYEEKLTQGMRPPVGTQILNEMEKTGVPAFSAEDIYGNPVSLSDFNDKVVIVNFWASWCKPCVKEFPSLIRMLETYSDEVVLLAISADKTHEDLMGFVKAFNVKAVNNFVVIWDKDQEIALKYGTAILPESYIVGKDRKLIRKVAGVEEWDSPLALEFFKQVIELNKTGQLDKLKSGRPSE